MTLCACDSTQWQHPQTQDLPNMCAVRSKYMVSCLSTSGLKQMRWPGDAPVPSSAQASVYSQHVPVLKVLCDMRSHVYVVGVNVNVI